MITKLFLVLLKHLLLFLYLQLFIFNEKIIFFYFNTILEWKILNKYKMKVEF